jgi:tetratricopeptide (TPR) repeat protein
VKFWHGFLDWRERRSALKELKAHQAAVETDLMDQNLNPLHLAKEALDRNDPAAAAMHWERARALLPGVTLTSDDSLTLLIALERYDEAEALMYRRHAAMPRDRQYLFGLARIGEARGDIAQALTRWETARDSARDQAEGYLGCARCLRILGRLDEAERQLNAAVRRAPDEIFPLLERARVSDQRQAWPASLERWKHIAEVHAFPPAFAFAAKAMVELGQADEAEAYLREPAALYPRDLEIAIERAIVAARRGDSTALFDRWAYVRWMSPDFQLGYIESTRCLLEAGRQAEAEDVLRQAIDRFPGEVWPFRDFARLAHDRGDWEEAASRWSLMQQHHPSETDAVERGAEAVRMSRLRAGEADYPSHGHCR